MRAVSEKDREETPYIYIHEVEKYRLFIGTFVDLTQTSIICNWKYRDDLY